MHSNSGVVNHRLRGSSYTLNYRLMQMILYPNLIAKSDHWDILGRWTNTNNIEIGFIKISKATKCTKGFSYVWRGRRCRGPFLWQLNLKYGFNCRYIEQLTFINIPLNLDARPYWSRFVLRPHPLPVFTVCQQNGFVQISLWIRTRTLRLLQHKWLPH